MTRPVTFLLIILAALSLSVLHAYHPPLRVGYDALPALERFERADSATGFDVTKYEITLAINDQTHFINGNVKAYVTAESALTGLDYNLIGLTVSQVLVNDEAATFTHQNGILHINLSASAGQEITTQVFYSGVPTLSPAPYNIGMIFGGSTVFTISDPDAARYWWPCYDHPWDKAIVDLHITMRSDWLVAANGLRDSIVDNGNGTKTHHWLGSNPMTTYLVCFTAGPYVEINQMAGNVPIQNFVTQNQYNNALTDFSTLPAILQFFETQFGPYPFEKYGNATVSMTTYGAMEHQTMTTLGSQFITGNHSGELVIAHELAHQWYGNCVSFLTFKDVWLSEGFATYSEMLWVHERDGWTAACNYVNSSYHQYYINFENAYSTLPNIIYDPPFNYYFYPQSYEKAASVLHMLRLKIGNASFFQLIQDWVSTYHNGNAITSEFQAMAEQISGMDLEQFFQQWIYSRGLPSVQYTLLKHPELSLGKVSGKSTSTTGTQFTLDIPFRANGLANGDSLIFIASPVGSATTFPLANGSPGYTVTGVDPNHWVLVRQYEQKDVVLTNCMASNQMVYLTWNSFEQIPGFAGYHVFRRSAGETDFMQMTADPIGTNSYFDNTVQNGTQYFYKVCAADGEGYQTFGSNTLNATPIEFPFDWGMLVVDETRDGTGSLLSPTDAMVDDFYAAALSPIPYSQWDYATLGAPTLNTLSHYPLVLWHSDDFSQIQISTCENVLSSYLLGGGTLVISGWKVPGAFSQTFIDTWFAGMELVYDNGAVLISAQSGVYPALVPDPEKLTPTWNGLLSMVYTFGNTFNNLYTAQMTAGAAGAGLPIAVRYDNAGTVVLFGAPLYYMQPEGVRGLMQQLIPELLEVSVADNSLTPPAPLSIACYPNPFSGDLTIELNRKLSQQSSLKVYNLKGQLVADIAISALVKEGNPLNWDGRDNNDKPLPAGLYLLRLSDGNSFVSRKVILLK